MMMGRAGGHNSRSGLNSRGKSPPGGRLAAVTRTASGILCIKAEAFGTTGSESARCRGRRRMSRDLIRWGCAAVNAAYTAFLLYATHHPKPHDLLPGVTRHSDKLLHLAAYGVLGGLTTVTFLALGRAPRPRAVAGLFAGLALFAAIDEATQPLFRRAADPIDWLYDCAGLALGILVVAVAARFVVRPAASHTPSPANR